MPGHTQEHWSVSSHSVTALMSYSVTPTLKRCHRTHTQVLLSSQPDLLTLPGVVGLCVSQQQAHTFGVLLNVTPTQPGYL
jgi:hypothetical protein